jgi:hypothetical protein
VFVDPFTYRDISDDTFDQRVVDYQLEREEIADRLDEVAAAYVEGDADRSDVDELRAQLDAYDAALEFMQEQAEAATYPEVGDYEDEADDGADWVGYDADVLDEYEPPDWWIDDFGDYEGYEFEFGIDYQGEE